MSDRIPHQGFPPYEPKHTKEDLAVALSFLVENKDRFSSTANYAKVVHTKTGVVPSTFYGQACHANSVYSSLDKRHFEEGNEFTNTVLLATENGQSRRHLMWLADDALSFEEAEPFLRWFLNDSHWGVYVVNRDDPQFCWDHGFVVVPTIPTILLQSLLIVTRHFFECHTRAFVKFGELLSAGLPGLMAYCFCFGSTYSRKGVGLNHAVGWSEQHRAVTAPSLESLNNYWHSTPGDGFFGGMGKTTSLLDPVYFFSGGHNNYYGGVRIFRNKGDISEIVDDLFRDKKFKSELSTYRKGKTSSEVYTPPNPFSQEGRVPVLSFGQITYEELFDFVTPYLIQLQERN